MIQGWQNGQDLLDFTGAGLSFTDFTLSTVGNSAVLTLNSDADQTITFQAINAASIDQNDFV